MTAAYTFDVLCSLDGYGSFNSDGDWGGYCMCEELPLEAEAKAAQARHCGASWHGSPIQ